MKHTNSMAKDLSSCIELGVRIAMYTLYGIFVMFVLLFGVKYAFAADLKSDSVLSDDYIRLGDVFTGVKNADYVLGPAPQPGKDMILNASTLYKIASALDVDWKPSSATEQVIIRREAIVIPQSVITEEIEDKIRETGLEEKFTLTYTNNIQDIVLPLGTEQDIEITAFNFDPQKNTFHGVVASPSAQNPIKKINVSGRVERMVSVPVLTGGLKAGDIIGAQDISYIEIPQNKVSSGMVVNEEDLINKTPKRTIASNKPIILNDLSYPKMVDRGDDITLVFATGTMMLTVKGKSLQAGAMGDVIRVTNLDSSKNLQGIVTAHREVTIR
jgi:flagellar basal body P-ring formation protein FlgA